MPPKKAAKRQVKTSPQKRATIESSEEVVVEQPTKYVDLTVANVLSDPVAVANSVLNDRRYYWLVAGLLALFQLVLGIAIILKVPCRSRRRQRPDPRHEDRLGCVHAAGRHVPVGRARLLEDRRRDRSASVSYVLRCIELTSDIPPATSTSTRPSTSSSPLTVASDQHSSSSSASKP